MVDINEGIEKLGAWHQAAHDKWVKEQQQKAFFQKRDYYNNSYLAVCEILQPIASQNARSLGIYPVRDAVTLMTPTAVTWDSGTFFYTVEFPRLETSNDDYGVAFKSKLNTQLGYFTRFYGGQLPCEYLQFAMNLRVVMVRNTGSLFIAYLGLMNDPWTAAYINRRYGGK